METPTNLMLLVLALLGATLFAVLVLGGATGWPIIFAAVLASVPFAAVALAVLGSLF